MRKTSSRLARRTSTDAAVDAVDADLGEGAVTVVGVHEQTVGDRLDARRELADERQHFVLLFLAGEPQLHHLAGGVLGDELAR